MGALGSPPRERRREHPPPDFEPDLDVGIREDDGELVAADPVRAIAAAHDRGRDLADRRQESIAGIVALAVIDRLEAVDVEDQEGERGSLPLRFLELEGQLVLECAVIAQAGQAIDERRAPACP